MATANTPKTLLELAEEFESYRPRVEICIHATDDDARKEMISSVLREIDRVIAFLTKEAESPGNAAVTTEFVDLEHTDDGLLQNTDDSAKSRYEMIVDKVKSRRRWLEKVSRRLIKLFEQDVLDEQKEEQDQEQEQEQEQQQQLEAEHEEQAQ